jgi:tetraacyldisaccharide 4'-kinase
VFKSWAATATTRYSLERGPGDDPLRRVRSSLPQSKREPYESPLPVICCGGATVGGAGKTTIVDYLASRIPGAHILTRGYGGYTHRIRSVSTTDSYAAVGDEPLLHAATAVTWRCADRSVSARHAFAAGATALIMDDGLQNRTLKKTISLLIVDGNSGFGNGKELPFGPLREPLADVVDKVQAVILIGEDRLDITGLLSGTLPVFPVSLRQHFNFPHGAGQRYLAFTGIARPTKFYQTLRDIGVVVVETRDFPNHYPYEPGDVRSLIRHAQAMGVRLVTTPKDFVRLPTGALTPLVDVAGLDLIWQDEAALSAFLNHSAPGLIQHRTEPGHAN